MLSFEPLPRALYARARSGSNAFGDLAAQQGPLMIVLMSVSWTDGADDAVVDRAVRRMMAEVEADPDADTHPWRYMNYAASWQKAIASYGAASVARLQAVSRTYDPSGVFQKLVAGGQKLPV